MQRRPLAFVLLGFVLSMTAGCVERRSGVAPPPAPEAITVKEHSTPDFPAPVLSEESRRVWKEHSKRVCERSTRPRDADCKPRSHTVACQERDYHREISNCRGSYDCLRVVESIKECERCRADIYDRLWNLQLREFRADCEGMVRFFEESPDWSRELVNHMKGGEAITCLGRSRHPRARAILARWRQEPRALEVLLGTPRETIRWLRYEFDEVLSGEGDWETFLWLWDVLDLLGEHASTLLPELRRVAVFPFVSRLDRSLYAEEALRRLGRLEDTRAVPMLTRMVADYKNWRFQLVAAQALADLGPKAAVAEPALRELARSHWSEEVQTFANYAAERVSGRPVEKPDPRKLRFRWDEQCPTKDVRFYSDRGRAARNLRDQWPWVARVGDAAIEFETYGPTPVEVPAAFPRIDLHARFGHVRMSGVSLHQGAKALREVGTGWVVGTNFGEFGGSLWWVDRRGSVEHLAYANVHAIVELGGRIYAIEGLAHMGASEGALILIEPTHRGIEVSRALELPEAPRRFWVREDRVYFGTARGIVAVDPDLRMEILPCVGRQEHKGILAEEQIRKAISAHRPAIERCFSPVPKRAAPCGESLEASAFLWFVIDPEGQVTEVAPAEDFGDRTPEVDTCLANQTRSWRFPPPEGGWLTFGYEFVRRSSPGVSIE